MSNKGLPPGSMGWPIIGETLGMLKDNAGFLDKRFAQHGPVFKTHILFKPCICFGGAEAYHTFLNPENVTRVDATPPHVRQLFGASALPFIDGAQHAQRKGYILQGFSDDALRAHLDTLQRIFGRYLSRWTGLQSFAWAPELESLVFDVLNSVISGANPDSTDEALKHEFMMATAGALALPINLSFTAFGRSLRARDRIARHVEQVIAQRQSNPGSDLISELLRVAANSGGQFTLPEIQAEGVHLYFAGQALHSALTFHLLYLAQHPEALRAVREEVLANGGKGQPLSWDRLEQLPLTRAATWESRRYGSVVPHTFFGRILRDFEFKGYTIPKGWTALGLIRATQHDPATYPQAERYDVCRFSGKAGHPRDFDPAFVAHGGGPEIGHRCAGERLADLVMTGLTAHLVQSYQWQLPPQNTSASTGKVSNVPADGLKVRFEQLV